jgi:hypothetical protein
VNLHGWTHRIVAKLALVLLTTLTVSVLPTCRRMDDRSDAAKSAVDVLKAILGAD